MEVQELAEQEPDFPEMVFLAVVEVACRRKKKLSVRGLNEIMLDSCQVQHNRTLNLPEHRQGHFLLCALRSLSRQYSLANGTQF